MRSEVTHVHWIYAQLVVELLIRPGIILVNSTYVALEYLRLLHEAVLCSVDDSNYLTCTQVVSGTSKTTGYQVIFALCK